MQPLTRSHHPVFQKIAIGDIEIIEKGACVKRRGLCVVATLEGIRKIGDVELMEALGIKGNALGRGQQKRGRSVGIANGFAYFQQRLRQVLAGAGFRLIGPEQASQRRPLVWSILFDRQIDE